MKRSVKNLIGALLFIVAFSVIVMADTTTITDLIITTTGNITANWGNFKYLNATDGLVTLTRGNFKFINVTSINVTENATASYFIGNGTYLTSVAGDSYDQDLNIDSSVQFSVINVTNITTSANETWGIFNNGSCIVIGDLQYVSEC